MLCYLACVSRGWDGYPVVGGRVGRSVWVGKRRFSRLISRPRPRAAHWAKRPKSNPLNQHGPVTPSSRAVKGSPRAAPYHEPTDTNKQATKPARLSFSGTPRPIRRPGGLRRRSGAALQIRTSRASTGVHAASPPREAHPTLNTTSPGAVAGPLAAASGALSVEHRPPARPSSER